ncbi:MAG: hypothetical protein G01um101444_15 [Parcubacteria group bacterium Gr01-1014_44]|nr:MAG: hypothetical protein G01um101444_15 [Parcubacteria group bacterium Gr01-1014_44]
MVKIIGVVLLIGAGLVLLNREKIEDYKQRIIEIINPAVKEKRILGELEKNLDQLGLILTESAVSSNLNSKSLSASDKQKLSTAVSNAQIALQELKSANQKLDLGSNLSNLIQKLIPFSANPSPTWLPPGQACPTPLR